MARIAILNWFFVKFLLQSSDVPAINPSILKTQTKPMQQMHRVTLCSLFSLASMTVAVSAQPANIAWVSFHAGDNAPSAGAAAVGFTQAPDIGYTTLLTGAGYNVTRIVTADNFDVSSLYAYDLVIIGRSVPSGHYQQANETAAWNGFTGKLIDMGGYTMRASRLGWTTGDTIPDTSGSVTLKPAGLHPIFQGIPVDGATGNMFNPFATAVTYMANGTSVNARGISVNTNPLEGGGQVLATVGTPGDPAFGGALIALWGPDWNNPTADPQLGVTKVNGGTDVLGGWRMAFLSGAREASGVSSETAGVYDLTPDGAKLFLNSVNYFLTVVPEPSSVALFAFGGLALLLRRKKV